jgi:prepilin signal peptidase PulO-like enzyme (type II secretory pathway)
MYTHESNKIKIHIARAWLNPVLRIGRIGCQLLPSWPSSALSHWQPRTLDTHIHITIRFDSLFLFYYFIFPGGRDSYIAHPTPPIAHYCLLSVFILFFFFQDRV